MSKDLRKRLVLDCLKLLILIVILAVLFMGEWYNGDLMGAGFRPLQHFHDAIITIIGLVLLWGLVYLIEQVWLYD